MNDLVGAEAQKTEKGKCPKCGNNVKYDAPISVRQWPLTVHPCLCPKCKWEGNEVSRAAFVEMKTVEPFREKLFG